MTASLPDSLANLRFLTMKEIATLTTYTPQHLYRLERQGRFPARYRIGLNRVGWKKTEVEKWIADRQIINPITINTSVTG